MRRFDKEMHKLSNTVDKLSIVDGLEIRCTPSNTAYYMATQRFKELYWHTSYGQDHGYRQMRYMYSKWIDRGW